MSHYLQSKSSYEVFFKKYYQAACLVSLRYVHDPAIAEDLVQDVIATIWDRRDSLSVRTKLKHYLFTSVRNQSINYVQRNQEQFYEINEEIVSDESSSAFSKEEMAVRIHNAIHELPPKCQQVFRLAYHENYTYNEISQELSISVNTVKTQMGIAYKSLRDNLKALVISFFHLKR